MKQNEEEIYRLIKFKDACKFKYNPLFDYYEFTADDDFEGAMLFFFADDLCYGTIFHNQINPNNSGTTSLWLTGQIELVNVPIDIFEVIK